MQASCLFFGVCRVLNVLFVFVVFASQQSFAVTVKGKTCEGIQKAIDKLPEIGGEIFIPAGTYTCSTPIMLDRDNVIVRGEGAATLLRVADKANIPVFVMGQAIRSPTITRRYIQVKNLMNSEGVQSVAGISDSDGALSLKQKNPTLAGQYAHGYIQMPRRILATVSYNF